VMTILKVLGELFVGEPGARSVRSATFSQSASANLLMQVSPRSWFRADTHMARFGAGIHSFLAARGPRTYAANY
jgi:hypothetical protein